MEMSSSFVQNVIDGNEGPCLECMKEIEDLDNKGRRNMYATTCG